MKIVLALFISYIIGASSTYSAQTVDIYTHGDMPPYAYRNDSGELTGVYIEIVKTAIGRLPDYSEKFHIVPWERAKVSTKNGRAFAILPPYFHAHDWLTDTEPKRPYIWPYSLPLYTQQDIVVCNASKLRQRKYHYPDDFQGLSFVMSRGDGRAGVKFDQLVRENKIEMFHVNTMKDTVRLIAFGRHDCTISSKLTFAWHLNQLIETPTYHEASQKKPIQLTVAAIISKNEGYLGYTDIDAELNFPFKKDFSIKFDIEIYRMRRNGEINDIVSRFVNLKLFKNLPLEHWQ